MAFIASKSATQAATSLVRSATKPSSAALAPLRTFSRRHTAAAACRTITTTARAVPSCSQLAAARSCRCTGQVGLARLLAVRSAALCQRAAYSSSSAQPPESKLWSFEDIQKLTKTPNSPVVIIDTREPTELKETGHIPGAINIPVTSAPDSFFVPEDDFEDRFGFARPSPDTEVVFYCKAGVRSRAAAGLAKDAGWKKVGEYPGSWLDWAGKGGAVER